MSRKARPLALDPPRPHPHPLHPHPLHSTSTLTLPLAPSRNPNPYPSPYPDPNPDPDPNPYADPTPLAAANLTWFGEGRELPSVSLLLLGLLGAALLALALAYRSLRRARADAGYHGAGCDGAPHQGASGGATPSPTFKGVYRPFLPSPSREDARSWPDASVVVSHYEPPATQGAGGPHGSRRGMPPADAEATSGCETAGETTAGVSTVIHVPRAIRLVHPQLHASPPSSLLESAGYVRM